MADDTGQGEGGALAMPEELACETQVETEGTAGMRDLEAPGSVVQTGISMQSGHGKPQSGGHVSQLGAVVETVLDQEPGGRPPQKIRKVKEDPEGTAASSGARRPGGETVAETPRDAQKALVGEGETTRRLPQGLDLEQVQAILDSPPMKFVDHWVDNRFLHGNLFACRNRYKVMFGTLPPPIRAVLKSWNVTSSLPDGLLLYDFQSDPDIWLNLMNDLTGALEVSPESFVEARKLVSFRVAFVASRAALESTVEWTRDDQDDFQAIRAEDLKTSLFQTQVEQLVAQWRKWKPRDVKRKLPQATQLEVEREYRRIWLSKLLDFILPRIRMIPKLFLLVQESKSDPKKEIGDLFGKMSWGTIRGHVGSLKFIIQLVPDFIPWDDDKVRTLFNSLKEVEVTPRKVDRLWYTVKKVGAVTGLSTGLDVEGLESKKVSIQGELVTTLIQPQHRAKVPTLNLVIQLEWTAVSGPSLVLMYIAAFARFLVGSSARFNDAQHAQPSTMKLTETTIEFYGWQSKTQRLQDPKRKPLPLICPLHSFSGAKWWMTMVHVVKFLGETEVFKGIDYLLPRPSDNFTSFSPRPCSIQQALSWFRRAMAPMVKDPYTRSAMAPQEEGPSSPGAATAALGAEMVAKGKRGPALLPEEVMDFSWHSCRVFMPEWAYKANIPLDRRRYLGRWTQENTADTYTRDRRSKVCQIWDEVTPQSRLLMKSAWVPSDLCHPHYKGAEKEEEDQLQEEVAALAAMTPGRGSSRPSLDSQKSWLLVNQRPSSLGSDPSSGAGTPALSALVENDEAKNQDSQAVAPLADETCQDEQEEEPAQEAEEEALQDDEDVDLGGLPDCSEETGSLLGLVSWYLDQGRRMPCDEVPRHWGGPFHTQVNVKASGTPLVRKIHVYDVDMKAVGCGYRPVRGATHSISAFEIKSEPGKKMSPCKWCFKKYTWPMGDDDPFETSPEVVDQVEPGAISDGSSSSSSSNDSVSDEEAEDLLKIRPPPLPEEVLI